MTNLTKMKEQAQLMKMMGVDGAENETPFAQVMEMMKLAGGWHTVPQILIDGRQIGGCDELLALDAAGKLDPLLGVGS